ncbi:uncharacterized protein LY89DRAFT_778049 [Mollisia scopiformis]|uniref:Uncharacterized protein n=1 Tax=Mollisia scopiformis TaxID=149040 RepID=A0A194XPP3_MOLSC|nr:uncharacterized protein LY89DRAFT_778049 [Mollisia scopiformis]KUJ22220.1 hypothetical protein LY89DRAFT_778049 [Mollisia scopiformis]
MPILHAVPLTLSKLAQLTESLLYHRVTSPPPANEGTYVCHPANIHGLMLFWLGFCMVVGFICAWQTRFLAGRLYGQREMVSDLANLPGDELVPTLKQMCKGFGIRRSLQIEDADGRSDDWGWNWDSGCEADE